MGYLFLTVSLLAGAIKGFCGKKTSGYIIVMAVCLFLNTYFKSIAVPHLPTAVIYPLNQGAALILSTVMASLFFGEKLTAKCISGLITAFAGLLIINVL